MTYSIDSSESLSFGNRHGAKLSIDITSYTTNGESIGKTDLEIGGKPTMVLPIQTEKTELIPSWDKTNEKLILTVASTGAELANAGDGGTWDLYVFWG